ncbi:MAG: UTRA domain-containing protein, partial [Chloroflexota bacterium]
QSIHWLLSQKYDVPLVKMVHTVERQPMTQLHADLLDARVGEAAFMVDRLSYTERDGEKVPVVLFEAVYRENSYYLQAVG